MIYKLKTLPIIRHCRYALHYVAFLAWCNAAVGRAWNADGYDYARLLVKEKYLDDVLGGRA